MDHFGIGSGVNGAMNVYFQSARGTGRTQSLVNSLKDGDRVVFLNQREGRRVQSLCKDRGVEIVIIVNDPRHPETLFGRGSPSGRERTIFDHSWVERFYVIAAQRAQDEIDRFQVALSGRNEPVEKTDRVAYEYAKWEHFPTPPTEKG